MWAKTNRFDPNRVAQRRILLLPVVEKGVIDLPGGVRIIRKVDFATAIRPAAAARR